MSNVEGNQNNETRNSANERKIVRHLSFVIPLSFGIRLPRRQLAKLSE
jgi:hypothetical protein